MQMEQILLDAELPRSHHRPMTNHSFQTKRRCWGHGSTLIMESWEAPPDTGARGRVSWPPWVCGGFVHVPLCGQNGWEASPSQEAGPRVPAHGHGFPPSCDRRYPRLATATRIRPEREVHNYRHVGSRIRVLLVLGQWHRNHCTNRSTY